MQGKVVVITGATSGVGRAAAEEFARRGARVVFTARDATRGAETLAALKAAGPNQAHRAVFGDLFSLADMKRVGAEIAAAEPKIDVLANNAGAMFLKRIETVDGLESSLALNHMAYFAITNALLPSLKAVSGARIVSTSSLAHRGGKLAFDPNGRPVSKSAGEAYGDTKLYNILFTRELSRRLSGSGVTANVFHPGVVASGFARNNGGIGNAIAVLSSPFSITPAKGAETLIYLATSPDVATVSGKYFANCKQVTPSAAAQDDDATAKLWAASEKIAEGRQGKAAS